MGYAWALALLSAIVRLWRRAGAWCRRASAWCRGGPEASRGDEPQALTWRGATLAVAGGRAVGRVRALARLQATGALLWATGACALAPAAGAGVLFDNAVLVSGWDGVAPVRAIVTRSCSATVSRTMLDDAPRLRAVLQQVKSLRVLHAEARRRCSAAGGGAGGRRVGAPLTSFVNARLLNLVRGAADAAAPFVTRPVPLTLRQLLGLAAAHGLLPSHQQQQPLALIVVLPSLETLVFDDPEAPVYVSALTG